jgi:hypothetical protein
MNKKKSQVSVKEWGNGDDSSALAGRLIAHWKEETRLQSSPHQMMNLPSFREIVQLGQEAVPVILRDLHSEPSDAFLLLQAITGENPVPESDYGDLDKIVSAWLQWGKDHGHWSDG